MEIRSERPSDEMAIRHLVTASFAGALHSSGTEAAIVEALRDAGALTCSLVAEEAGAIVGHVAFSPVSIDGVAGRWFGLGPVAVRPDRQQRGIGQKLIAAGLEQLQKYRAQGCVVLGDPAYYGRLGFESDPALHYPDVPAEYFQRLSFDGSAPSGTVAYHPGFAAG